MVPVTCTICQSSIELDRTGHKKNALILTCDHEFHKKCFSQYEKSTKKQTYPKIDFKCPNCVGLPIIKEVEKGPSLFQRLLAKPVTAYAPVPDDEEPNSL